MTPGEAMTKIEGLIGHLAEVRAWLHRHEMEVGAMNGRDAHRLALCQWSAAQVGEALAQTANAIGRLDLRVFGQDK